MLSLPVKLKKKCSYKNGKKLPRMVNSHTFAKITRVNRLIHNVNTARKIVRLIFINLITQNPITGSYAKVVELRNLAQK